MSQENEKMAFLGAGGAAEAGIPTARQMTDKMLATVGQRAESEKVQHAVRLAVASVIFGQGMRNENLTQGVNIEDVFNLLNTLAERHTLEASPLIGSWHPLVEKLDLLTVGGRNTRTPHRGIGETLDARDNARKIAEAIDEMLRVRSSGATRDLAEALENVLNPRSRFRPAFQAVEPAREVPGGGVIYGQARDFLYRELKNHVFIRDNRDLSYLDPLVIAAERDQFSIATLNYDNSIELVAKRLGIEIDNGLKAWRDRGEIGFGRFDAIPFRKLHGSITWSSVPDHGESKRYPLPRLVIQEATNEEIDQPEYKPALIFGGRNKLTAEGPFLELLRDFRERLNHSSNLMVIGYSFADDHINEILTQWLNKMEDARVTIVNGPNFSTEARGFARKLLAIPGDRIVNTGEYAAQGIARLFGHPAM